MDNRKLKAFLERKAGEFNRPGFIPEDPVSIPHRFTRKQDIEIAGFFAAIFSWGNRRTIIGKSTQLMQWMDEAPYDFIRGHQEKELRTMLGFAHRTFNATDLLYFIRFLSRHYGKRESLESAFIPEHSEITGPDAPWAERALNGFYRRFFALDDAPDRTRKHIAAPTKKSTCKRLNMYLRWMVRKDNRGVDFGIWEKISPADLICPVDVHVARVARKLGLLTRKPLDWQAALELTARLRRLDAADPVKYDFALFGLGVADHY